MLLQITPEISVESTQKMCSLNIWKGGLQRKHECYYTGIETEEL